MTKDRFSPMLAAGRSSKAIPQVERSIEVLHELGLTRLNGKPVNDAVVAATTLTIPADERVVPDPSSID